MYTQMAWFLAQVNKGTHTWHSLLHESINVHTHMSWFVAHINKCHGLLHTSINGTHMAWFAAQVNKCTHIDGMVCCTIP